MKEPATVRGVLALLTEMSNGKDWQRAAGVHGTATLRWWLEEPAAHDTTLLEELERQFHEQRDRG